MKRMLLLLLAAAPCAIADEASSPFAAVEVAPGIYQIGNTNEKFALNQPSDFVGGGVGLLVGDEYIVMIDDVLESTAPALVAKAEEIAGRPIDFVINTHAHGDHVGGNVYVTEKGALVVSHDQLRARLAEVLDEVITSSVRRAVQEEMPRLIEQLEKEQNHP